MKNGLKPLWSVIATAFIFTTITSSAVAAELEAVIDKARAYLGSEEALNGIETLQYKGNITIFNEEENQEGRVTLTFAKPFSQTIFLDLGNITKLTGYNGYEGYEQITQQVEGEEEPLVGTTSLSLVETRRLKASSLENLGFFRPYKNLEDRASYLGQEELEGKQVDVILYEHPGGFEYKRFFDVTTGDMLKSVTESGITTIEEGDITVDGIQFTQKVTVLTSSGKPQFEMVFDEILVNPEIPGRSFDYPLF